MKRLLSAMVIASICAVAQFTDMVVAADGPNMTLQQIRSAPTAVKARSYHNSVRSKTVSAGKSKQLQQAAIALRGSLRSARSRRSPDQQWANLIAPVNFCTDLVVKVCGAQKQCADRSICTAAVGILELYNAQSTEEARHEFEYTCITALSDPVFSACQ